MASASRSTLVFSQPPKSIHLVGRAPVITYSSDEHETALRAAYERGVDESRRALEAEIIRVSAEAEAANNGALSRLAERHEQAVAQMRALLPRLVVDATARVVAGITVDAGFVKGVVNDLLNDVAPGAENVEIQLCPEDAAKVAGFDQELRHKFPTLRLIENNEISPGDCLVKTRFGVLDGRMSSKLKAVEGLLS
jgi:flagellar assembly protein FliH